MEIASVIGLALLQGSPGGGGGDIFSLMLPMIVVFAIFYFLVLRPQQKRQRKVQQERDQLLNSLKSGDKVVTTGGIYGTIVAARDETVTLRIADKVQIEVQRAHISGMQPTEVKEVATEATK